MTQSDYFDSVDKNFGKKRRCQQYGGPYVQNTTTNSLNTKQNSLNTTTNLLNTTQNPLNTKQNLIAPHPQEPSNS